MTWDMTTAAGADFDVSLGEVKLDFGGGGRTGNSVEIAVTNTGTEATVRVTMLVSVAQDAAALFAAGELPSKTVFNLNGTTSDLGSVDPALFEDTAESGLPLPLKAWWTNSKGRNLPANERLVFHFADFPLSVPPGTAQVCVLVQVMKGRVWQTILRRTVDIVKDPPSADRASLVYFRSSDDVVSHAGRDPVELSFLLAIPDEDQRSNARVAVLRNGVPIDLSRSDGGRGGGSGVTIDAEAGTLHGVLTDFPSITTTYRLRVTFPDPDGGVRPDARIEETVLVQVLAPGWNQITFADESPLQLFAHTAFGVGDQVGLYGLFHLGERKVGLRFSAGGLDDWVPAENGLFPREMVGRRSSGGMETSPGVVYQNRIWLVGGSSVDMNRDGADVWSYGRDPDTGETGWRREDVAPLPDNVQTPPDKRLGRAGHSCVVVAGEDSEERLLVIGGFQKQNRSYFSDVLVFQPETRDWEVYATAPWTARRGHSCTVCNTKDGHEIWLFGGNCSGTDFNDIWMSKDGKTWDKQIDILPSPGGPLGASLGTTSRHDGTDRVVVLATFLDQREKGNTTVSYMFELKDENKVWHRVDVGRGWQTFSGAHFGLRSLSFEGRLYLWSVSPLFQKEPPVRLSILL
ncbi:hypothetical protein GQ651_15195 [Alphaproteobacteria bacterium GH1-50]|uniref:Kelch motif protein n=1 Tax=Kangsaoukella pontilimi TaxID=2691042 RepID=A0A7C9MF09_9RHOB|nr:kelch repeat-containing protein [Kangsaoukella pontilimi]MXQ09191.1 hypothetical protein [Kangsaoukella pontilimi]